MQSTNTVQWSEYSVRYQEANNMTAIKQHLTLNINVGNQIFIVVSFIKLHVSIIVYGQLEQQDIYYSQNVIK